MKIVVALGGNALLRRGEPLTEEVQVRNVKAAAASLHKIARHHQIVVTHGNGPQVGLLALESEAYKDVPPYGLDVLVAESQGMIGFIVEQALRNELKHTPIATVLTSTLVDADDPAFDHPTKPIGPVYPKDVAARLARKYHWQMATAGEGLRRLVPSPTPRAILQLEAIRVLVDAGVIVICAGGGGVPVVAGDDGELTGVKGVVDKDLTSALLAEALGADWLLLLTDVDQVQADWGTTHPKPIHEASVAEMRRHSFASGSMGPKVEAACQFVERTGRRAAIGALDNAEAMLSGIKGTVIRA
jgi:carbamate kinase